MGDLSGRRCSDDDNDHFVNHVDSVVDHDDCGADEHNRLAAEFGPGVGYDDDRQGIEDCDADNGGLDR